MPKRSVFYYLPSLYWLQGLFYSFITVTTIFFYKTIGYGNSEIILLSTCLAFAWVLKPFFAPFIERLPNNSQLITSLLYLISIPLILLSMVIVFEQTPFVSFTLFFILAMLAANYDIATDGYYILHIPIQIQTTFIGLRCVCFHLGGLFCQGGLVLCISYLFQYLGILYAWQIGFMLLAALVISSAKYHRFIMPDATSLKAQHTKPSYGTLFKVLRKQPQIGLMILFIIFYIFPENQFIKIFPLYMLDNHLNGGLNFSVKKAATIEGFLVTTSMMIGLLTSGILLKKFPVKLLLIPSSALLMLNYFCFYLISFFNFYPSWLLYPLIIFGQFMYGINNSLYMLCLVNYFGESVYPVSFYAIGTTLMALGTILAGLSAGTLKFYFDYSELFLIISLLSLANLFFLYFARRISDISRV